MEAMESCGQDKLHDVEVDQPKTLVNREAAILEGCTPPLITELEQATSENLPARIDTQADSKCNKDQHY